MSEGSSRATRYSPYFLELDPSSKERYKEKLTIAGGIDDPYVLTNDISSNEALDWQEWPNLEYPDIYNYLVTSTNCYMGDQLEAYKSLEGYKYYVDGWVSDVLVLPIPSNPNACLISAHVKHSQRLSSPHLHPWVVTKKEGEVICAHCNCMAGLEIGRGNV